jgi:hypothetical protein
MNAVFVAGPVGHEAEESQVKRSPFHPVAVYVLAAGLGGAVVGTLIGAVGVLVHALLPYPAWLGLVAALLALGAFSVALEMRRRVAPLWQRRAQVPREWTHWRSRTRTAAAFGLLIGGAIFTFLDHAVAYVLGVSILIFVSPLMGFLVGLVYGVTRGSMLLVAWLRRSRLQSEREDAAWRLAGSALPLLGLSALSLAVLVVFLS